MVHSTPIHSSQTPSTVSRMEHTLPYSQTILDIYSKRNKKILNGQNYKNISQQNYQHYKYWPNLSALNFDKL